MEIRALDIHSLFFYYYLFFVWFGFSRELNWNRENKIELNKIRQGQVLKGFSYVNN